MDELNLLSNETPAPVTEQGTTVESPSDLENAQTTSSDSQTDIPETSSDTAQTAQTEETQEEEVVTEETLETETETYQLLQEINIHTRNIEMCSITIVIALGLLYGAKLCKIFLDKVWR